MTQDPVRSQTHGVKFCLTGWKTDAPHELRYNGKAKQTYICRNCDATISKADLKAATDA